MVAKGQTRNDNNNNIKVVRPGCVAQGKTEDIPALRPVANSIFPTVLVSNQLKQPSDLAPITKPAFVRQDVSFFSR
jgi:hypothetical protein